MNCLTREGQMPVNLVGPAFNGKTEIDHGKHRPLQWNIGTVHKYTGCFGIPQLTTLPSASRQAPR
jgi:hypothetical protein